MATTRRSLLRAVGAGATVASTGCLAGNPLHRGPEDFVTAVEPAQSFEYDFASVHTRAATVTETQLVFVTVEEGIGLSPHELTLTVGDDTFASRQSVAGVGREAMKRTQSGPPVAVFELPSSLSASDGTVTIPGGHDPLSESVLDRLTAPPELSVGDLTVPPDVTAEGTVPATLSLRNEGEHPATFRATIGDASLSGRPVYSTTVPWNRETDWTTRVDTYPSDGSTTVVADWTTDERRVTVGE